MQADTTPNFGLQNLVNALRSRIDEDTQLLNQVMVNRPDFTGDSIS